MFGLTILPILIICEPLFCLARPQYFCCLPCPLTNDCEDPYYRHPSISSREEPPSLWGVLGNIGGRGDGSFSPPSPPLPEPPRPREPKNQGQVHGKGHGQGPDQNCINLIIKCHGEREAYEDPYNRGDWFRGNQPDGTMCWVLQCNDQSSKQGGYPPSRPESAPPSQQASPTLNDSPKPPPPANTPPPPPPANTPQPPPPSSPSQNGPPPDISGEEPSDTRHPGNTSLPETSRRQSNFFSNLFSLPGQLADSMLAGSITVN